MVKFHAIFGENNVSVQLSYFDRFCFQFVGTDVNLAYLSTFIDRDERLIARSTTVLILSVLITNFVCTYLGFYDIFFDLQEKLTYSGYLMVIAFLALFWSLIVFNWFRLMLNTIYQKATTRWRKMRRILILFPILIVFLILGFLASIPIQVRLLADDVRLEFILTKWLQLGDQLLEIELTQLSSPSKSMHPCVENVSRISILFELDNSLKEISQCELNIKNSIDGSVASEASLNALSLIRKTLTPQGIIDRSSAAFLVVPGESWILVMSMMLFFTSPALVRLMANRRPFEYLRDDAHRHLLTKKFLIELYSYDKFDEKGLSIPVVRYHGVEDAVKEMKQRYESIIQK